MLACENREDELGYHRDVQVWWSTIEEWLTKVEPLGEEQEEEAQWEMSWLEKRWEVWEMVADRLEWPPLDVTEEWDETTRQVSQRIQHQDLVKLRLRIRQQQRENLQREFLELVTRMSVRRERRRARRLRKKRDKRRKRARRRERKRRNRKRKKRCRGGKRKAQRRR